MEEQQKEQLEREFDKRVKVLGKIGKEVKEELHKNFINCYTQGFKCYYCGNKMELKWGSELSFTLDHYIPKSKSGLDTEENLVFCCRTCNLLKSNMDAQKYISNMERIRARKNKREYWKARTSSKKDERTRDAFKDIFQIVNAKKEREER